MLMLCKILELDILMFLLIYFMLFLCEFVRKSVYWIIMGWMNVW